MQYADKENKTIMCHFLVPIAEKQSTTRTRNINNTTDFNVTDWYINMECNGFLSSMHEAHSQVNKIKSFLIHAQHYM